MQVVPGPKRGDPQDNSALERNEVAADVEALAVMGRPSGPNRNPVRGLADANDTIEAVRGASGPLR